MPSRKLRKPQCQRLPKAKGTAGKSHTRERRVATSSSCAPASGATVHAATTMRIAAPRGITAPSAAPSQYTVAYGRPRKSKV